jgi:hypothetical protein
VYSAIHQLDAAHCVQIGLTLRLHQRMTRRILPQPCGFGARGVYRHIKLARELQRRVGALQQHRPVVFTVADRVLRLRQSVGHVQTKRHAAACALGLHLRHPLRLPNHVFARLGAVVARRAGLVVVSAAQRDIKAQVRPIGDCRQIDGGPHMPANGAGKRVHHQTHVAMAVRVPRGAHSGGDQADSHQQHDTNDPGHRRLTARQSLWNLHIGQGRGQQG